MSGRESQQMDIREDSLMMHVICYQLIKSSLPFIYLCLKISSVIQYKNVLLLSKGAQIKGKYEMFLWHFWSFGGSLLHCCSKMTVTGVHCIVKASNVQLSIVDLIVFLEGVVCGAVNLYCVMSGFY